MKRFEGFRSELLGRWGRSVGGAGIRTVPVFLVAGCVLCSCFVLQSTESVAPVDVGALLASGDAVVRTSEIDIGDPSRLFDGDTGTLARSANVNPMFIELEFKRKARFQAVRVHAGQAGYPDIDEDEWYFEAADDADDLATKTGSYFRLEDGVRVRGNWGEARLPAAMEKKLIRIWVKRTLSPEGHGDYVHVSEIALR